MLICFGVKSIKACPFIHLLKNNFYLERRTELGIPVSLGRVSQIRNVGIRSAITVYNFFERRDEAQMGNGREKTSTPVPTPKEGRFEREERE